MKKLPKEINNNRFDWLHFGQGYLSTALLICDEILDPKHENISILYG